MIYTAIDLFSGCGGMTQGLKDAGFSVLAAVEFNDNANKTYRANHSDTHLFHCDIRTLSCDQIKDKLGGNKLYLLVGCPPCQGFSAMRRRNRKTAVPDERNSLILEYLRFVKGLLPSVIMLENVPAINEYDLFQETVRELEALGYSLSQAIVDVANYGVPQRRKRYVLIGSRIGKISIPVGNAKTITVRDVIGKMESPDVSLDKVHRIYPKHTARIQEMIEKIPMDGGSRKDLPEKYILECHKREGVGFNDVYGRLKWDRVSSTITGGCLNPSKGRFLHPDQHRNITAREAALLQTFPMDYIFPVDIPKTAIALMIGNALPPEFSRIQCEHIKNHIELCNG